MDDNFFRSSGAKVHFNMNQALTKKQRYGIRRSEFSPKKDRKPSSIWNIATQVVRWSDQIIIQFGKVKPSNYNSAIFPIREKQNDQVIEPSWRSDRYVQQEQQPQHQYHSFIEGHSQTQPFFSKSFSQKPKNQAIFNWGKFKQGTYNQRPSNEERTSSQRFNPFEKKTSNDKTSSQRPYPFFQKSLSFKQKPSNQRSSSQKSFIKKSFSAKSFNEGPTNQGAFYQRPSTQGAFYQKPPNLWSLLQPKTTFSKFQQAKEFQRSQSTKRYQQIPLQMSFRQSSPSSSFQKAMDKQRQCQNQFKKRADIPLNFNRPKSFSTFPSNTTWTNTFNMFTKNKFSNPDNKFTNSNTKFTVPNNKFTVPNNIFTVPNNKFTVPNNKFTNPNSKFTNPNSKFTIIDNNKLNQSPYSLFKNDQKSTQQPFWQSKLQNFVTDSKKPFTSTNQNSFWGSKSAQFETKNPFAKLIQNRSNSLKKPFQSIWGQSKIQDNKPSWYFNTKNREKPDPKQVFQTILQKFKEKRKIWNQTQPKPKNTDQFLAYQRGFTKKFDQKKLATRYVKRKLGQKQIRQLKPHELYPVQMQVKKLCLEKLMVAKLQKTMEEKIENHKLQIENLTLSKQMLANTLKQTQSRIDKYKILLSILKKVESQKSQENNVEAKKEILDLIQLL